jgi:RCC1 and BTB domain-containing protein
MAGVRIRSVAAFHGHNFALSWQGELYSWGSGFHGVLGHDDEESKHEPAIVDALRGQHVVSVTSNMVNSFAITEDGKLFSWGTGHLRTRCEAEVPHSAQLVPAQVEAFRGTAVRMVAAASYLNSVLVVSQAGEVFSWGKGFTGLLGHGDIFDVAVPRRIAALQGVRVSAIAVGSEHALALSNGHTVFSWGLDNDGSLGHGEEVRWCCSPKIIGALRGICICEIGAGRDHSCAITDAGQLFTWGSGLFGKLGHGDVAAQPLPKLVARLDGTMVVRVSAGHFHTLAVAAGGDVHLLGSCCPKMFGMPERSWGGEPAATNIWVPRRIHVWSVSHAGVHAHA